MSRRCFLLPVSQPSRSTRTEWRCKWCKTIREWAPLDTYQCPGVPK